jgi:hypothetical protein
LCYAFGKQIQARETWNKTLPNNTQLDRATEVFHTEKFKSVEIYILKDGTVEFRNRGADFSTTFSNSIGLSLTLSDGGENRVAKKDPANRHESQSMSV